MEQDPLMKQPPSLPLVRLLSPLWPILLLAAPRSALATVNQPTGESMPQPANPSEISCCVTGRGFPAAADTLAGLFMYHQIGGVAGGDTALIRPWTRTRRPERFRRNVA